MKYLQLKEYINSISIDDLLRKIICCYEIDDEKNRYLKLIDDAFKLYGDGDYHIISSPGRSEIGGNHTDHQHGHVLAASLNIDNVVVVKSNNTNICNFYDSKFNKVSVNLDDLSVNEKEYNTSVSLIRGIANKLNTQGYKIGGFDAICDSHVLIGSGISSSACFEVMIVEIFNALFNDEKINPIERAIIGQYAENVYFGKPSGLMDQMAISVGGFVAIDFKDINNPKINNYDFSFEDYGYELLFVNTYGNHSDLSYEYATIPNEIKLVSKQLGVEYLADATYDDFISKFAQIKRAVNNDRALLRANHFFLEDDRAVKQADAVKNKDIKSLLKLINESGKSSFEYLQNVYQSSKTENQPLALALCMTDMFIKDEGAYRVHGGGFDGTIQVIIPKNMITDYKKFIENTIGKDCILQCKIRPIGTVKLV